ncbi:hypothetical protein PSAC2689_60132 [Paraburkholderia sacchari]
MPISVPSSLYSSGASSDRSPACPAQRHSSAISHLSRSAMFHLRNISSCMVNYRNVQAARKQKFMAPGENTERISGKDVINVAQGLDQVAKTLTVQALTRVLRQYRRARTWGNYRPKKVFWRRAEVTILPKTFHPQYITP